MVMRAVALGGSLRLAVYLPSGDVYDVPSSFPLTPDTRARRTRAPTIGVASSQRVTTPFTSNTAPLQPTKRPTTSGHEVGLRSIARSCVGWRNAASGELVFVAGLFLITGDLVGAFHPADTGARGDEPTHNGAVGRGGWDAEGKIIAAVSKDFVGRARAQGLDDGQGWIGRTIDRRTVAHDFERLVAILSFLRILAPPAGRRCERQRDAHEDKPAQAEKPRGGHLASAARRLHVAKRCPAVRTRVATGQQQHRRNHRERDRLAPAAYRDKEECRTRRSAPVEVSKIDRFMVRASGTPSAMPRQ